MKIKNILAGLLIATTLNSCSDYLDIVPDDTPLLKDAFKNETSTEGFVFSCYGKIPNYFNFRGNFSWATSPEMVGSAHWTVQWFTFMKMQQALYSPGDPIIDVWQSSYEAIRQCYIFLDNVDKVTPVKITEEEFAEQKKVWKAEVNFLVGYYHYLLLQNYGPIVIIDKLIPTNAPTESMQQARLPYDECVEKIAEMFDKAIPDLPETVDQANLGRATKVVAQALKAKMYLYAASPQFNGNPDYANFKDKEGNLLVSNSFNKEKWKKAMEECKKAIQIAEGAGVKLYKYTPKSNENLTEREQAIMNCRYVVVDPWNSELIWGYSGWKEGYGHGNSMQTHIIPKGISKSSGAPWGALGATLYSANLFLTENGLPMDKDPKFKYNERFTVPAGEELPYLHMNREPRFYASLGFNNGEYLINDKKYKLHMYFKEANGAKDKNSDQLYGGYAIAKLVNPSSFVSISSNSLVSYPFPIIRLADLYLGYAEASAEYNGTLSGDARDKFNQIRNRAGLPNIEVSNPGVSGKELVEVIRRERTVEFMYEGQMLYDYRRWKIAEKEWTGMTGGMTGLNVYGTTPEEYYKHSILDRQPFNYSSKQNLSPIRQSYLDKNPKLVQNPGW